MQKFSFFRGWVAFLSKKKLFFHAKYQILRGWVLFLVPFFVIFLSFFLNVLPNSGGPVSAAVRVLTAVNAGSLCTLAGGWRSHESSSLFHSLASAVWGKSVGRSLFQSSHASAQSAPARTSRVAKAVWEKPVHPSRWGPSLFRSSLWNDDEMMKQILGLRSGWNFNML